MEGKQMFPKVFGIKIYFVVNIYILFIFAKDISFTRNVNVKCYEELSIPENLTLCQRTMIYEKHFVSMGNQNHKITGQL